MGQFTRQRWFLRFRRTTPAATIDEDLPCSHCGYNLRGLKPERQCPECGLPIPRDETDPATLRSRLTSPSMRLGLALSAVGLFFIIPVKLLRLLQQIDDGAFAWLLTGSAIMWGVGTLLFLQSPMDAVLPTLRNLRRSIRISQAFWIVAYIIMLLRILADIDLFALVARFEAGSEFIAAIGAIALAWYMKRMAEELETQDAARRFNVALWCLPVLTLLLMAFPAKLSIPGLVMLGLVLLLWCAAAFVYATGLYGLSRYLAWTRSGETRLAARDERVAATREQLDREVSAKVRPLENTPLPWQDDPDADIPME